jgi:hypothetical protein
MVAALRRGGRLPGRRVGGRDVEPEVSARPRLDSDEVSARPRLDIYSESLRLTMMLEGKIRVNAPARGPTQRLMIPTSSLERRGPAKRIERSR